MTICIGCGENVPGLEEGDFCRLCGGDMGDWDYEDEAEGEPEDAA